MHDLKSFGNLQKEVWIIISTRNQEMRINVVVQKKKPRKGKGDLCQVAPDETRTRSLRIKSPTL